MCRERILKQWQETHEQKLDLSEHDPDLVDRLIRYLYTMEIYDSYKTYFPSLVMCIGMCMLADLFDIERLKVDSVRDFEELLRDMRYREDFCARLSVFELGVLVERVYDNASVLRAFCDALVKVFVEAAILASAESAALYQPVLMDHPQFAFEVAKATTTST